MDKHMRVAKLALAFSASALMLVVAIQLLIGPRDSSAHSGVASDYGIAALEMVDYNEYRGAVLLADGRVLEFSGACDESEGFSDTYIHPLPVPVSEIRVWGRSAFVTNNDEVWVIQPGGSPCNEESRWKNLGQPPNLPIATSDEPTSTLKRRY